MNNGYISERKADDPAAGVPGLADILAAARANLFFVVGSPRSGTTWMQRALDGHPQISCAGEGHFIEELAPRLADALAAYGRSVWTRNKMSIGDEAAFVSLDDPDKLLCLAMLLLMHCNARPGSVWIGEKTPANVLALERLARLLPTARFIHICRDPRDVCVSAWYSNLRLNRLQTLARWPNFASYVPVHAQTWAERISAARQFAAGHAQIYREVAYEALSVSFEAAFRGVLQFLGAPADAEILARCRQAGSFERAAGRAPGSEDPNSHFRRGERGNWRMHFNASLAQTYAAIAGSEMRLLGYDP
jgi:hypothetical protein